MATAAPPVGNHGFSVDLDLVKAYHLMNKDKKESYLSLKFSADGKKIVLDEKGPIKPKNAKTLVEKNKHWETLLGKLPDNEIRYILIQVDYKNSKLTNQNDILFIAWVPDGVDIMKRMEVDKHKVQIQKPFLGIKESLTITQRDDWNVEKIVKERLKGTLE